MGIEPLRIGVVGCGNISGIYFDNLRRFKPVELIHCADLDLNRAKQAAENYKVRKSGSLEELLANPDVELVLNLTVPNAHAEISLAALRAGKHIYSEKPLAVTRQEGRRILETAGDMDLVVGCAPDTFLGGAHQTCRKLIDEGAIGQPVAAQAFMLCHGHENWHPAPEFYYQAGGGPMFDMGPYYLTALVNLMGGVRRVTACTRATFPTRTITSEPRQGKQIPVETPTHISGVMDFENGAVGAITTSFDVWHSQTHPIAIYGSEGSMLVPDPNGFGGEILVRKAKDGEWHGVPIEHGFTENRRGLGVMDLAYAVRRRRPPRASGAMAYHVLDIMQAFLDASDEGRHIDLTSAVSQPASLPPGLPEDDILS